MTDLSVREAQASDIGAIESLLTAAALPLDGIADATFVIAERDGIAVGCAAIEQRESAALLRSVAVAAESRGRGAGELLVRAILDTAERRNLGPTVLLTTTARAWFPRFGFREIERADVPGSLLASAEFRGACPDTAVIMRRDRVSAGAAE